MATVSVVVPSWNDAPMLEACLTALLAQTRPADEIIVVDNASTDATAEVARRFGARVVSEPVRGILRATCAGFDAARGDIIARLDADSLAAPEWLEGIERALAGASSPSAIAGPCVFYGGNPLVRWFGQRVYLGGYFAGMRRMFGRTPLFGSNMAMHAAVWHDTRDRVDRTARAVHDDLYISIRLAPGVTVLRDERLAVAISARPFASPMSLGRRAVWGLNTLFEAWRRGRLTPGRAEAG